VNPFTDVRNLWTVFFTATTFAVLDVLADNEGLTIVLWVIGAAFCIWVLEQSGQASLKEAKLAELRRAVQQRDEQLAANEAQHDRALAVCGTRVLELEDALAQTSAALDEYSLQLAQERSPEGWRVRHLTWLANNPGLAEDFDTLVSDLRKAADEARKAEEWLRDVPIGAELQASRVSAVVHAVDEFTRRLPTAS
jgi:hypothetical protein